jgi:DNA-binding transcriptional regulator YdaS (Cro superfamily)
MPTVAVERNGSAEIVRSRNRAAQKAGVSATNVSSTLFAVTRSSHNFAETIESSTSTVTAPLLRLLFHWKTVPRQGKGMMKTVIKDDVNVRGGTCEVKGKKNAKDVCNLAAAVLPTHMETTATKNSDCNIRCWQSLRQIQTCVARLVLEVFGGAGAIWGSMEILGLRTSNATNQYYWRIVAGMFGIAFMIRLVWQEGFKAHDWWRRCCFPEKTDKKKNGGNGHGDSKQKVCSFDFLVETLAVKLVLEVLGAAGAAW